MTKCEVIDLTLSNSDSDGDFIQAKKVIHPFLYQVSVVHQVSITSSSLITECATPIWFLYPPSG